MMLFAIAVYIKNIFFNIILQRTKDKGQRTKDKGQRGCYTPDIYPGILIN
jgi:hypothetical protein